MSGCCPTCGAQFQGPRRPTLLQKLALEAYAEFTDRMGYRPTAAQLGQMLGIHSYQQTYELIRSLVRNGWLTPRLSRAERTTLPFHPSRIVPAPPPARLA